MSLLEQLERRGVTAEDLEKAAAVRLFEKAASAEGVNLDELSEQQVSSLFDQFTSNFHPTKEASTMNGEIVDLFEKTAADEGIDLGEMSDEDFVELYNYYVENVLPEQIEAAESEHGKEASVNDAHEKLAEAEILGRHMARAYLDELEQHATVKQASGYSHSRPAAGMRAAQTSNIRRKEGRRLLEDKGAANSLKNRLIDMVTGRREVSDAVGRRLFGKELVTGKKLQSVRRMETAKAIGKRVGVAGGVGALGYGGYRAMKKESSAEIQEQAHARAEEFAQLGSVADYDGSLVDDVACDILSDNGYTW